MKVVIVGASVAGIRTAQALRSRDFTGPITIIGDESHPPYDKPPLSKEMLDAGTDGKPVPLIDVTGLRDLSVNLALNTSATGIDVTTKTIITSSGEIPYDTLIIATGVTPRTLSDTAHFPNVYTIRTADDARRLRTEMIRGRRVAVIGAGFIGAEFASAAVSRGVQVTVIEAQQAPLASQLGPSAGAALADLHHCNGVTLLAGVAVNRVEGVDRASAVRLTDGRTVPCDFVVVGIGTDPCVDWLTRSPLETTNGVATDACLRALGVDDVYAAGDVALREHPLYGEPIRIEHWTNANDHAEIIAADLLGTTPPRPSLPYVWSDQYGKRIQIVGRPAAGHATIAYGTAVDGDLVVGYTDSNGVLVGALVLDNPRLLMKLRKAITAGANRAHSEAIISAAVPVGGK